MKIIVLGAGQVGTAVVRNLVGDDNEITVVDREAATLRQLQERQDIKTVVGHASHPGTLQRAGIEDADMVLAVTDSDETNMMACQVAQTLFHTPMRLARVRSREYLDHPELLRRGSGNQDVLISPERLVTECIGRLIERPGATQVLDFLDGRVQLVTVRVGSAAVASGASAGQLMAGFEPGTARLALLYREGKVSVPQESTRFREHDDIVFVAERRVVRRVIQAFHGKTSPNRTVFIAGGGRIGLQLAQQIESDCRVKIIDSDRQRCRLLAETLERSLVLHGDVADTKLLASEDIGSADLYCAITDDDEVNILSAMLARKMGAKRTLSIVNRAGYVDIAQGLAVDIAISPAQITIGTLLMQIRRGDVQAVHALHRGDEEALELVAHGTKATSAVVGRRIDALPLPSGTRVLVIARGDSLRFPAGEERIEAGDRVLLLSTDRRNIRALERLFEVSAIWV